MVTKLKKKPDAASASTGDTPMPGAQLSGLIKESAQQIWQAGLGAFAKAQAEGGKAFDALVKEGTLLQRKTQAAAEEKITEATSRMSSMANDISSKATGQWDKLENIFEKRVAKALNKLGVPSAKDINALIARIYALNDSVQKLSQQAAAGAKPAAAKKAAPAKKVAAKAPAKKAAAKAPAKKAAIAKKAAKPAA